MGIQPQQWDLNRVRTLLFDGDARCHVAVTILCEANGRGLRIKQTIVDQGFEGADLFVRMVSEGFDEAGDFLWFKAVGDNARPTKTERLVFLLPLNAIETRNELERSEQLDIEFFQNLRSFCQKILIPGDKVFHSGNNGMSHMADVREVSGSE